MTENITLLSNIIHLHFNMSKNLGKRYGFFFFSLSLSWNISLQEIYREKKMLKVLVRMCKDGWGLVSIVSQNFPSLGQPWRLVSGMCITVSKVCTFQSLPKKCCGITQLIVLCRKLCNFFGSFYRYKYWIALGLHLLVSFNEKKCPNMNSLTIYKKKYKVQINIVCISYFRPVQGNPLRRTRLIITSFLFNGPVS